MLFPIIALGLGLLNAGLNQSNANKADRKANALNAEADRIAMENLDFAKENFAKWEGIFGPVQKNIADYYAKLGPARVAARGLENQQTEFQAARKRFTAELTKRGLNDSGVEVFSLAQAEFENARVRAEIKSDAPGKAIAEQTGFLQLGLQEKARLEGNVLNAGNQSAVIKANQAGAATGQANQFNQNVTNSLNEAVGGAAYYGGIKAGLADKADANQGAKKFDPFTAGLKYGDTEGGNRYDY